MAEKTLEGKIKLVDEFSKPLKQIQQQMKQMQETFKQTTEPIRENQESMNSWKQSMNDTSCISNMVSKIGTLVKAYAGLSVVKGCVSTYAEFEQSMKNVQATTLGTQEDYKNLCAEARRLGAITSFSAKECGDGMNYFAMAGFNTNEIISAMKPTLDLASASGLDLAETCDIVSDGLGAFHMGKETESVQRFSDVLATVSAKANTNVHMMGETMKYCASSAGALGYSIEDVSMVAGLMGNEFVKSGQAGTSMKNMFVNLAKPTESMEGVMKKYNISLTNADGSTKSLKEVVDNLRTSLGNLDPVTKASAVATLAGKEGMAGWMTVINTSQEALDDLSDSLNNANGNAQKMADIRLDSLSGQCTILKSGIDEMKIALGEQLAPYTKDFVQWFTSVLPTIQTNLVGFVATVKGNIDDFKPILITIKDIIVQNKNIILPALKGILLAFAGFKTVNGSVSAFRGLTETFKDNKKHISDLIGYYNKFNEKCAPLSNTIKSLFHPIQNIKTVIKGLPDLFFNIVLKAESSFIKLKRTMSSLVTLLKNPMQIFKLIGTTVKGLFTSLRLGLTSIMSPAVIVVGAVILVGLAIKHLWNTNEQFRNRVKQCWETIKTSVGVAINGIVKVIDKIKQSLNKHQTAINAFKTFMGAIWEGICTVVQMAIETLINIIEGIVKVFSDIVTLISDICTGNWSQVWEDFKQIVFDAVNQVKQWWNDMVNAIKSNPVVATVSKIFTGGDDSSTGESETPTDGNATGTDYWRGGYTKINEKGGEIANLPNGTQIIPHDLSIKALQQRVDNNNNNNNGKGNIIVNIPKIADSVVIREEADIDKLASKIADNLDNASIRKG